MSRLQKLQSKLKFGLEKAREWTYSQLESEKVVKAKQAITDALSTGMTTSMAMEWGLSCFPATGPWVKGLQCAKYLITGCATTHAAIQGFNKPIEVSPKTELMQLDAEISEMQKSFNAMLVKETALLKLTGYGNLESKEPATIDLTFPEIKASPSSKIWSYVTGVTKGIVYAEAYFYELASYFPLLETSAKLKEFCLDTGMLISAIIAYDQRVSRLDSEKQISFLIKKTDFLQEKMASFNFKLGSRKALLKNVVYGTTLFNDDVIRVVIDDEMKPSPPSPSPTTMDKAKKYFSFFIDGITPAKGVLHLLPNVANIHYAAASLVWSFSSLRAYQKDNDLQKFREKLKNLKEKHALARTLMVWANQVIDLEEKQIVLKEPASSSDEEQDDADELLAKPLDSLYIPFTESPKAQKKDFKFFKPLPPKRSEDSPFIRESVRML